MTVLLADLREPDHIMRAGQSEEGIKTLAASIKRDGLINPLVVRKVKDGYEIVAGIRRFHACLKLGLTKVRCSVTRASEEDAESIKAAENREREDVHPLDEGDYYGQLLDRNGWTQKELAAHLGVSEGLVSERLATVSWPEELRLVVLGEEVGYSVARELSKVEDHARMLQLLYSARDGGCTPAVARRWRMEANRDTADAAGSDEAYEGTVSGDGKEVHGIICNTCGRTHLAVEHVHYGVCDLCDGVIRMAIQSGAFWGETVEEGVTPERKVE